jgi:2-haloacid dehalogenase
MHRRDFLAGAIAVGSLPAMFAERAGASQALPAPVRGVRLLVFDTFGTVVDWRSGVIAEGEQLGRAKGLKVDWAAFADAWRGGYGPSMNRVRKGDLPWTKLDALHRMTLDDLLVKFKIEGLTEEEKAHFNYAWHRLRPWPDAVAGLTRMKKRFVIGPLSNGNVSLLTDMAKFGGLPWDVILSTELVRHYKPDRETYLMPGEFWDLKPESVMMVAAHAGDLNSARQLGLRTAFVHRPFEQGKDRLNRVPPMPKPDAYDFVCKDFKELASRLGT